MDLCSHLFVSIYFSLILIKSCYLNEIKVGVLIPYDSTFKWSVQRVTPAIELAIERISRHILPGSRLSAIFKDTECSATVGPLAAVDLYMIEHVDVLLGPVCDYALAPVARFSPYWNIPVLTPGGLANDFDDKKVHTLLTRVLATSTDAAQAFTAMTKSFNWTDFGLIYQLHKDSGKGRSNCYFNIIALHETHQRAWYRKFDGGANENDFEEILRAASLNTRIIVLCGNADSVREIMIKAHELNFDNGDYVFLNLDLFGSSLENIIPWYRENDTVERNKKARKAYEALMIISIRQPTSPEYIQFSREIRRRTAMRYENITYDQVNKYIEGFHNAVILYGLAVNETLEANGSVTNGTEVTLRMRNKTFQGITGDVFIDSNGDRKADYSLLDMNPVTGKFEVVLNYFGRSESVEFVPDKQIHWAGNYTSAPTDTPKCGFDNTECQTTDIHTDRDEATDESTKDPLEDRVVDLLEDLQRTMAKISEAVAEHNASISAINKHVQKQQPRSSADTLPCPQASTSTGSQAKHLICIQSNLSVFCLIWLLLINMAYKYE